MRKGRGYEKGGGVEWKEREGGGREEEWQGEQKGVGRRKRKGERKKGQLTYSINIVGLKKICLYRCLFVLSHFWFIKLDEAWWGLHGSEGSIAGLSLVHINIIGSWNKGPWVAASSSNTSTAIALHQGVSIRTASRVSEGETVVAAFLVIPSMTTVLFLISPR